MPSVSGKQHRFFGWAFHHPGAAGVPRSVSQEFLKADKGRHFQSGGAVTDKDGYPGIPGGVGPGLQNGGPVDIGEAAAVRSMGSRPHETRRILPDFARRSMGALFANRGMK